MVKSIFRSKLFAAQRARNEEKLRIFNIITINK